jgi:hypothetical protein
MLNSSHWLLTALNAVLGTVQKTYKSTIAKANSFLRPQPIIFAHCPCFFNLMTFADLMISINDLTDVADFTPLTPDLKYFPSSIQSCCESDKTC